MWTERLLRLGVVVCDTLAVAATLFGICRFFADHDVPRAERLFVAGADGLELADHRKPLLVRANAVQNAISVILCDLQQFQALGQWLWVGRNL